jgi:hypothetical protein
MRPTDRIHRVSGVRPSRRALAILPRLLPLSQSVIKHVRIVLFKSGNHRGMPEGGFIPGSCGAFEIAGIACADCRRDDHHICSRQFLLTTLILHRDTTRLRLERAGT